MKVLFVRSGNGGDDPISSNQGLSLERNNVKVKYFNIVGKGLIGYFYNINKCRSAIKQNKPDIIHAHYSLSGIISTLTLSGIPTGTSLMGSDINSSGKLMKLVIRIFSKYIWRFTIVKTDEMFAKLNYRYAKVIPNGVSLDHFRPLNKYEARIKLGWEPDISYIIFASDPERPEKNYALAKLAFYLMEKDGIKFQVRFLKNIEPSDMVYYYNAADVLLMTSITEGSPNVIKEAMACNCPVVSTDVGDVKTVIGNTHLCYITTFDPSNIADKLKIVLLSGKRSTGRENIYHLDDNIIAQELINLYDNVLKSN